MKKTATALLCALLIAAPGTAQRRAADNNPVSREALADFGRCIAERNTSGALRTLGMDFRTREYGTALRELAREPACAPSGRLASAGVLLAGAIAEPLLTEAVGARDFAQVVRPMTATPLPPRNASEALAMCVLRDAPAGARSLLSTAPGSLQELSMKDALSTAISNCMTRGQRIRMNAAGLRAVLAVAALRQVRHNAGETVS